MKTVLILSWYLEPCNKIGARRASYLAQYLSEKGYKVIVIKAKDKYYHDHLDEEDIQYTYDVIEIGISSRRIIPNRYLWYSAYKGGIKELMDDRKIHCMFITGEPFFYFPLGPYVKKKYRIPYILDFRDPWYQNVRLKSNKNLFKQP